jgi:CRISPR-associated protein Cas2
MQLLIAYDIQDDKRRKKISDILEGFGYRVNYSVFELSITKTKYIKLLSQFEEIVVKKEDSLRIYHLCEKCVLQCTELCDKPSIFEQKEMFV